MAKIIQNNFSGGEISPSLFGRSDLQAYYKGCASCENFVISKEGTLRKRHGISSIAAIGSVGSDYSKIKILPYKYDRTDGGFVVMTQDPVQPSSVTLRFYDKGGTLHVWYDDLSVLYDHVSINDFGGNIRDIQYKQIGDEIWISNGLAHYTVCITDNARMDVERWQQKTAPSTLPYYRSAPTGSSYWELDTNFSSSEKTIFYACVTEKDSIISEFSKETVSASSTWEAGKYVDATISILYADLHKWDVVYVCKRTGGSYGKIAEFYTSDDPDECYDSGNSRLYKHADGKWYTHVSGGNEREPYRFVYEFRDENHTPTDIIRQQTNTLGTGFTSPLCIDCYQQRRVFANASTDDNVLPMSLWFSEVGNIDNYYSDRPAQADDPFSPTIASSGPSFILFTACYQETMIIFTEAGLFSVGFSQTSGFSKDTCRISKFSDLASSPTIQPVVTEAGVVFVGADEKTVYTISYEQGESSLKPLNRMVMTEHLTRKSKITGLALQEYPDNVVWVSTEDGKACTFTMERNEQVFSWSHSRIDGANIIDVIGLGTCTDSSTDRTYGDLLFVVKKGTGIYLCRQNTGYADNIGGTAANVKAKLITLRPESQEQTLSGNKKNIKDVIFRLYESGGIKICPADGNGGLEVIGYAHTENPSGFTGDVKVMPRGYVSEDGQMTVVSDDGNNCEILQIVTNLEVE